MKIIDNCCLTNFNSYKIESFCKKAFFPDNENDLIMAINISKDFILIGSGHNIILSKSYYDSDFIILNNNFNNIRVDLNTNIIIAEAGSNFFDMSMLAQENGLTGMEFCYDIPSSVGGGVIMNAGTKEGEIKNILIKVRYFDLDKKIVKEKNIEELELDYRNSIFQNQKHKIVLKAWFQLTKGCKESIKKVMIDSKERRWQKQPREYPNAGSVFKRPKGRFIGPMLDELNLKGETVGGAMVSKKHSGFIVNFDNASGSDILNLIKFIQNKVKNHFDVELEVEQRII